MIFFVFLALLSFGGTVFLVMRHRSALGAYAQEAQDTPTFALFMKTCVFKLNTWWYNEMREYMLLFTEKQLRWVRILVLKIERLLFHAAHRVRGASARNGNSVASVKTPTSLDNERKDTL